jgi:NhaP-type Na+/H+ or K+/H+ antiporter
MNNGEAFPHRSLILFITFVVILVTLVFQGLTLPLVIRWTKIKEIDDFPPEGEQEAGIRLYGVQRKELHLLRKENRYSDEEIRKQESQLDLDEAKIN